MIRYEAAKERKDKILELIRSLDLPNNPLDDIIDQVVSIFLLFQVLSLNRHMIIYFVHRIFIVYISSFFIVFFFFF